MYEQVSTTKRLPEPATSDRVILLGNTEEGKSTLAKALLLAKAHVIVVDTKQNEDWSAIGPIVSGDRAYEKFGPGRYVWRPPDEYIIDMKPREEFFRWCLNTTDAAGKANRVIYLDEIIDSAESAQRYPRWMRLVAQRGRSANLGLWGSTQQPRGIPTWTVAQAQYVYSFHVGLPEYRDRIDEIMEEKVPWRKVPLRSHRFVYKDGGGMHGPYILDIVALEREQQAARRAAVDTRQQEAGRAIA